MKTGRYIIALAPIGVFATLFSFVSYAQAASTSTPLILPVSTLQSTSTPATASTTTSILKVSLVYPPAPPGSTLLYSQTDDSGEMWPVYPDNGFRASLGNLDLRHSRINITIAVNFTPQVFQTVRGEVCFSDSADDYQCTGGAGLQVHEFTDDEIATLSKPGYHVFSITTDTTASDYADGTKPVYLNINFDGGSAAIRANAAGTKPYLVLRRMAPLVSNVLFLPGFEGSRLYYRGLGNIEHQVWEPDFKTDIPYLEMNVDGTSKYPLYTKDIIDTLEAHNPLESLIASKVNGQNLEVYGDFANSMNSLVASSTFGLKEWRAYPYDWRYDVRDIISNGTATAMPDGSIKQVYLKDVLRQMASSSPSGKVTIVAHSNGGLLSQALMGSLSSADRSKYVDRIVTVGTPNFGAPSAIGALLHGDDQSFGMGMVANAGTMRDVAKTMPGAYGLLPDFRYLNGRFTTLVSFDYNALLTKPFSYTYGDAITNGVTFKSFLTDGAHLDAKTGSPTDLHALIPLSSANYDKAYQTHFSFIQNTGSDSYIKHIAIAGWGQDTVTGYNYTSSFPTIDCSSTTPVACPVIQSLLHTPVLSQDGDGTVTTRSAEWIEARDQRVDLPMYFNAAEYVHSAKINVKHQDFMGAKPIQDFIIDLLQEKSMTESSYFTRAKPANDAAAATLRISTHSPVNTLVTDSSGRKSGMITMPGTDFALKVLEIPGSSVQVMDDEQYINVPQGSEYKVSAVGYAVGPATVVVDALTGDGIQTQSTTIANVPTTASSTATFSVIGGVPTMPIVDSNGDGKVDFTVASSTAGSDPIAYVRYAESVITTLSLPSAQKKLMLIKLSDIEHKLTIKKPTIAHARGVLAALEQHVGQQVRIYKPAGIRNGSAQCGISPSTAEIILGMLSELKKLLA